ncbi:SusD/RagB family nutrient-binding outer membrane lipoprotein [Mucilaginibacter segetis]|uniref:SusD/RagB family nutrient-binding outer membrane lipoprotein n=1 Tax=Mucilaginibacter segetis TaxID=2793071 RepID=A0A934PUN6_9SPHI|nr:SusD/RagB family nutrient-binding outer membrane lipoprotein [Mucilaginibacter segetis]MBK0379917.1 SusD/RagB family nutrient-binding outer membrane lipoprotein [Mucilaginibacter segetis]
MRKIFNIILCGLVISSTSCNKFLDVNETNPNNPTSTSVDLVLPQALAATAATTVNFNNYGAWVGGFQANAGGYGGFGSDLTYNYTTNDKTDLWSNSYENINDYQYIINNSTTDGNDKNFNAIARTMRVFAYQRLVDVYGDVPYTQAVKGLGNLTPSYDKAEDIYTDLFKQLDTALTSFSIAATDNTISVGSGVNGKIDVTSLDKGGKDMSNWIAFANTIKLRLLLRIQNVPALASVYNAEKATLNAYPFTTIDVSINPGYAAQAGKQNPAWNSYAFSATNTASQLAEVPTKYAVGFYTTKTADGLRRILVYRSGTTGNQLGYTGSDAPTSPSGSPWLALVDDGTSASTATNSSHNGYGILKGPTAAMPIMLASESYFLQAEGNLIGIVSSGSLATNFNKGITASFDYLLRNASGAIYPGEVVQDDVDGYLADNTGNYLVNIGVATTDAQRLEAIITQKWIAMNYITSYEGWADFRRTTYPKSDPVPAGHAATSIASLQSISPRADKLPVRVLYPASEYAVNGTNAPSGIDAFTSRIFWDLN